MTLVQQIQLAEEDYLGAVRLHLRPRRALRIAGRFLLAALAFAVCADLGVCAAQGQMSNRAWGGLFFLIYFPLWYYLIVPFQARRSYRASPRLARPTAVELNDACVRFDNGEGEARVPWEDFIQWKSDGRLLLLYTSRSAYAILPMEDFAGEERARLLGLVESRLGPAKG